MTERIFREVVACTACVRGRIPVGDAWRKCTLCDNAGETLYEPITLEDLTAEAVKAERERIAQQVRFMISKFPNDQHWEVAHNKALNQVLSLLEPPKPPTPKEVVAEVVDGWVTGSNTAADEILAALASKGYTVEQV